MFLVIYINFIINFKIKVIKILMAQLSVYLICFLTLSLIFNYLSLSYKKTSMEIINEMGNGYNLGNVFDCYDKEVEIKTPLDQITLCGNSFPTKQMISSIKKSGFNTIRFPVTWINFIDENGNINSDWMKNVKEVVDLILNTNMYCILNIENDGKNENWLSEGIKAKNKYTNLWSQIANEFKDYDEHLVFESMDSFEDINYNSSLNNYDYSSLLDLSQSFIDTVRSSGGNNVYRLLLVSGANADLELTCNLNYKMPKDPSNMIAVSIHYYIPYFFTIENDYTEPYIDEIDSTEYLFYSDREWGNDIDYNEITDNFELIKRFFIDQGIPVVISEVGVLTEEEKKIDSIREYLYVVFSISANYNGIISCLWDTSKKSFGNMNYFDRESNKWYDEKIGENFKQISKGKYIKPLEYYGMTNSLTTYVDENDEMVIKISHKKPLKAIFNIKYEEQYFDYIYFDTYGKNLEPIFMDITKGKKIKEYDGSYTFTMDISKEDCNNYIVLEKISAFNFITFNYLTIEFNETFIFFDYKYYKDAISNFI